MTAMNIKRAIWLVLAASMAVGGAALAQQGGGGGPGGGGGGGGGPGGGGGETTATNNLSYPALDTLVPSNVPESFPPAPTGTLGTTYSYGCEPDETIGTTTYPDTSCVSPDGKTFYTAEQCTTSTDAAIGKCLGLPVERIYWQKTANKWNADRVGKLGSKPQADYVDWSDGLESVTWKTTSVIRVETTPFADEGAGMTGYQMWHVFGQGQTEQWGVRTTEAMKPYQYESPFAIIYTTNARLNIAKLQNGPATCPTTATGGPGFGGSWDPTSGWVGLWELRDIAYTAELNVGGKYVYGYNWQLRRDSVPPDVGKSGWWRLTFYTTDGVVDFSPFAGYTTPEDIVAHLAPPTIPVVPAPLSLAIAPAAGDTGPLYKPVVDTQNNVTYLDICIAEGTGSGGGGGGKGGGGGGKP
jgi:hypothetical protein